MMAPDFVFDACAVIALVRQEKGWEIVQSRLREAKAGSGRILMHNATVAEVYYDSIRTSSVEDADAFLLSLHGLPVQFIPLINHDLIKAIGFYKTHYKVSFADCFVLATAEIYNATIISSDRHEFGAIEKDGRLRFEWIR